MPREVTIPIALWVCAALVSHAAIGGGAVGVTHVEEKKARERADIRDMVQDVRRGLGTIELDVGDSGSGRDRTEAERAAREQELGKLGKLLANPELTPDARAEAEQKKREIEKQIEEEDKPDEKKEEDKKEEEKEPEPDQKVAKPMELLPPPKDDRIKIRQAARDDKDNPNANRLAEQALSVQDESVSAARSNNSVSDNPSFESNDHGPKSLQGNADKDLNAQTEDREGDKKAAPGSAADKALSDKSREGQAAAGASRAVPAAGGNGGDGSPAIAQAQPGAEGGRPDPMHDHVHGEHGWDLPEAAPGGDGTGDLGGFAQLLIPGARIAVPRVTPRTPGFGGGPGGSGTGLDLGWSDFVSAVGEAALDEQAARIGEERKAARKGQFDTEKFARWLPDIENYDPSVKLGNQTRLNAAQSVFATYLSTMHNAIHPIFADEFLASLNRLGKAHELNGDIVTHVEIILTRDEGKVVRMGITKNSGFTLFDAAALEAVDRASPFGLVAPDAIVSPDGHVYLHWEFHRDPVDACSTRNASPFIVPQPKPIKSNIPKRKPKKAKKPTAEGEATPATPEPLVPRPGRVGQGKTRKKK